MLWPQLLSYNDIGFFLLRLVIGVIFIYHALPKLKNPQPMAQWMGVGDWFPRCIGIVELVSGIGMILGIYIQLAGLLLSGIMVGAIYMKTRKGHVPFSAYDKVGWEFDLVLLAANLLVLLAGGGMFLILL